MAQHDFVVDNADGLTVRTDFNAAVQALVTCSSGPVAPVTPYPGMLWLDTSVPPNGVLRQRDQANAAWGPVLLPPEWRFAQADISFLARVAPPSNRFAWNDKADGSGTDIMSLSEAGVLSISGTPSAAGDVATKGYVDATGGVPVGSTLFVAMNAPPPGYLKANGASLLRASYPALFTAISTTFGAADVDHFSLPDLRGEFVRGWDDARGVDAARAFGSAQAEAFASHAHTASSGINSVAHAHSFADSSSSTSSAGAHTHEPSVASRNFMTDGASSGGQGSTGAGMMTAATTGSAGAHTHTVAVSGTTGNNNANHTHAITVNANGGAETRPRNIALLGCIKYQ